MALTTGTATDFITFTRASNATVTDADGRIKWAPHNLVLNSATPATQSITVISGAQYTVNMTGSGSVALSGAGSGTVTTGNPVTVTASTTTLTLTVSGTVSTMWAYRSDLGGMQANAQGSLYNATTGSAYYGPRRDFDSAGVCRGLLVEEQRSNSLTYSQEFDNGAWLKGVGYNSTVSANTSAAPDNTTTADSVLADSAGGTGTVILARSVAVTSGTSYTLTFFAKAGTLSWIRLFALAYTSPGNGGAYFNLSGAGAVGTVDSGYTASIAAFGNGWYRCSLSFTAGSSVTGELRLLLANANGDTAVARNGTSSVLVWGAQLEPGSFATSYIPVGSTTAGATRNADVASVSTQAFPYSASEGTLVVAWELGQLSGSPAAVHLTDVAESNRIRINAHLAGINRSTITAAGSLVANIDTSTAATGVTKYALGGKSADYAVYRNGSAGGTSTNAGFPSGCTELRIGRDGATGNFNGHIRQITYLPRRISNTDLQARTSA